MNLNSLVTSPQIDKKYSLRRSIEICGLFRNLRSGVHDFLKTYPTASELFQLNNLYLFRLICVMNNNHKMTHGQNFEDVTGGKI